MDSSEARRQLAALIETEAPHRGDRLPAERTLARRIGCSRETLRAALSRLEAEGAIWRHVGQGTFRGPRPAGVPLRETLLVAVTGPADLMEARLLIEPPVARAAATGGRRRDPGYLRRRVEAGRQARDLAACEAADSAFHRAVAETAGNPVLLGVLAYLADARRRAPWQHEWDRTYRRIGVAEFRGRHSDQHAAIAAAIEAGDGAAAEREMRAHLETVRAAMATAG